MTILPTNKNSVTIRRFEAMGADLELHFDKVVLKFWGGESRVIGTTDLVNHFEDVCVMLTEENRKVIKKNNAYFNSKTK